MVRSGTWEVHDMGRNRRQGADAMWGAGDGVDNENIDGDNVAGEEMS